MKNNDSILNTGFILDSSKAKCPPNNKYLMK